jgi:hypothetical protein
MMIWIEAGRWAAAVAACTGVAFAAFVWRKLI